MWSHSWEVFIIIIIILIKQSAEYNILSNVVQSFKTFGIDVISLAAVLL